MANSQLSTAELLYSCAEKMGLQPSWVTPSGLIAISLAGQERYINVARSTLNSDVSSSLAKNKYLTRLILERNNLPNIPFAQPSTLQDARKFLAKHKTIIVKPINGSGARDIRIIKDAAELDAIDLGKSIFEKYIVGSEMRYLVLNDNVIGMYKSDYGESVEVSRDLQCIAYPRHAWNPALTTLSVQIADLLGLKFAAVDYLVNDAGEAYILEVNNTPDLKWFHAPTSGPKVDVASLFLNSMLEKHTPAAPATAL